MEEKRIHTLSQVSRAIARRIDEATGGRPFWVKAEIASINHQRHVYLELAEHKDGQRTAVMRAIIWQQNMGPIRAALGDEMPNILKEGAEVLFLAHVRLHPVYGLALHVEEIDLAYSLGELERRKRETMATLRAEGLFDLNRSLPEPMVVQRIALVASEGSAAYQDFMRHLADNEHGYRFHVRVFPSQVQGDTAPQEMRRALAAIDPAHFDAVVLVRGGGSRLDLEAFNDLELCRAVARIPIPVMTGIGHDIDVSVVDMIAHGQHKTPTAIADHLVDKALYFETQMQGFMVDIQRMVTRDLTWRHQRFAAHMEMLRMGPAAQCQGHRAALQKAAAQFIRQVTAQMHITDTDLRRHRNALGTLPLARIRQVEQRRLNDLRGTLDRSARHGLEALMQKVKGMHDAIAMMAPERTLARGFSITRVEGQAVGDAGQLREGSVLETTFAQGRAWSTVTKTERHG